MKKQKIAVIFGGHSTEYDVSLAIGILPLLNNINTGQIRYYTHRNYYKQVIGFTIQENMKNISNNTWFER